MTLLNRNVTKSYKKTDHNVPIDIATKDKLLAEKLELDDRIDVSAHRDPFITTGNPYSMCVRVFDQLPVVSWRRAKYKQMYGLKSTLTVSR